MSRGLKAVLAAGAAVVATATLGAAPASAATLSMSCSHGSDDRGSLHAYYTREALRDVISIIDYQVYIGPSHGNSTNIYWTDHAFMPARSLSTGAAIGDNQLHTFSRGYTRPRTSSITFRFVFDHSGGGDPSCSGYKAFP